MRVALVQLPHFYGHHESRPPESYPLGLGYIASVLRQSGVDPVGIDLWSAGLSVQQALADIDFSGFDVIGISAYSTQYRYLKEFSLGLKRLHPSVPLVCGGPGPTFSHESILMHTGIDICVVGEGEQTFVELLSHLDDPGAVEGLALVSDGRVTLTPARSYIRDLDALPLPDRDIFDLRGVIATASAQAAATGSARRDRRPADIIAGRGCPYDCRYCSKTFSGCRLRGIDSIIGEVCDLVERYGVNHLSFNDELVLVNKRRSLALCDALAPFGITWSCQGRIDQVDEEILSAMAAAGCIEVGYGVESVTQSILDAMNKRQDAGRIVPVIEMTRAAGITPIIQYMFGYPGESDESIEAGVRFFKRIDHPFIAFTTTPIPGSALYQECRERGLIGDEEKYLLRLDSGYNLQGALLNLTDFTDEEFLEKKRRMQYRVTHNFLKRRPLQYLVYVFQPARFRRIIARVLHRG